MKDLGINETMPKEVKDRILSASKVIRQEITTSFDVLGKRPDVEHLCFCVSQFLQQTYILGKSDGLRDANNIISERLSGKGGAL